MNPADSRSESHLAKCVTFCSLVDHSHQHQVPYQVSNKYSCESINAVRNNTLLART